MTAANLSGDGLVRSRDNVESFSFRDQNFSILVHGKETDDAFTVIDYEAPMGVAPPPHRHDFAEVFYVLEGEVTVQIEGETVKGTPGEAIYVPSGAAHAPRAEGHIRAVTLAVPAGIEQYFMEANEIIKAHDGPVTMEALGDKILPLMKKYTIEPVGPPPQG